MTRAIQKYKHDIDLDKNQLLNALLHPLNTDPASPHESQVYYNTVDKVVYVYNGTAWVSIGALQSVQDAGNGYFDITTTAGVVSIDLNKSALIDDNGTGPTDLLSAQKILNLLASAGDASEWQNSVLDRVNAPPGSPVSGARYLIIATATGAFEGKENQIAIYNGSAWSYVTPTTGTYVSVDDEGDGFYFFGGSSWTKKYHEASTVDDVTLGQTGNQLFVKDGGISEYQLANNSVVTHKIANGHVTTAKLDTGAVTSDKLADSSVIESKLASDSVTSAKIVDANVTESKLASNSVTSAKIANSNVTTAKIADANVTADKLASDSVTTVKIVDANVTVDKLASDSVTTVKILDANVTADKLASNAVTTAKILDSNVTTAKINDGAVTAGKLASDSVTTVKILDANVTADKLASDAVTTAKILNANVTTAKINDAAVTTAKINDAAVTTGKINDGAVTGAKIGTDGFKGYAVEFTSSEFTDGLLTVAAATHGLGESKNIMVSVYEDGSPNTDVTKAVVIRVADDGTLTVGANQAFNGHLVLSRKV
jgi:hypothetical protein